MNLVVGALLLSFTQTVRIQLESEMTLHVTAMAGGAKCHARLVDSRGAPIANGRLWFRVTGAEGSEPHAKGGAETDANGKWTAPCVQGAGRQRLEVEFAGNARARGVIAEVVFEPEYSGGSVDLDAVPRRVAWSEADPLRASASPGASVEFRVTGANVSAGAFLATTVVADRGGVARLPVELWRTAPGRFRVEARRLDGYGSPMAVASRFVVITSAVRLLATAKKSGAGCSIAGNIRASHGPVAQATLIAIVADEPRHAMTSDVRGNFSASFACPDGSSLSQHVVDVLYQPDRDGLEAVRTRLTVANDAPSPGGVLALSVGAAILLFAAVWGVGRLRGALRRESSPVPSPSDGGIDRREQPVVGVAFARSRSMFGTRSTIMGGIVVDAVTSAPVNGARLVVTALPPAGAGNPHPSAPLLIPVDANGRFEHDASSARRLRLTFQAPDYLQTTIDVRSPHRGEYRAMCVSLLSVREAIRDLYVEGSARLGVSRARALRASPHEIVATAKTPTLEPIAAYATAFEGLFFAAGPRTADDHRQFANHVARLPDVAPTERDRLAPLRPVGEPRGRKESIEVDGQST